MFRIPDTTWCISPCLFRVIPDTHVLRFRGWGALGFPLPRIAEVYTENSTEVCRNMSNIPPSSSAEEPAVNNPVVIPASIIPYNHVKSQHGLSIELVYKHQTSQY